MAIYQFNYDVSSNQEQIHVFKTKGGDGMVHNYKTSILIEY